MSQNFSADSGFVADISRIINYAPPKLIGRENETKLLNDAWTKVRKRKTGRCHILTFVALGGEGKTSLVTRWVAALADKDWPGCDAAFAWSFYRQGTGEQAASSDLFLKEALTFFGDVAMANSAQAAYDKGRRLAQIVGERQALLILDGLEPLQYALTSPTPGELKDQAIAVLLKGLAAANHGLCVVTTRYAVPDLRTFLGKTVQEEKLTRLSREAGVALLQTLGVKGSLLRNVPFNEGKEQVNEFEKLVEDVQGHALTLNLLGSYLRDCHSGDIRLRDLVKLQEADAEEQGGHAFRVMDAYVQAFKHGGKTEEDNAKGRRGLALLELLGLFDRPATADCLNTLWKGEAIAGLTEPFIGLSEAQRNLSLTRLKDAKLITVNRDEASGALVLDAHPLVREYFAKRLSDQQPGAWRAAHSLLYEYFRDLPSKQFPDTLEEIEPLYRALSHGCNAGRHKEALDEVYLNRILRKEEYYSMHSLGAFGMDLQALSGFLDRSMSIANSSMAEKWQAFVLICAGFDLKALGRPLHARLLMESALQLNIKCKDWTEAANDSGNLGQLSLSIGDIGSALTYGRQSVEFADRSGNKFHSIVKRSTWAEAFHQAGDLPAAKSLFKEAERLQRLHTPETPLLFSVRGFRYCDLLMDERQFPQVQKRARYMLTLATKRQHLLSIALAELLLGESSMLYAKPRHIMTRNEAMGYLHQAVDGLRRAGYQDELPRGLITRAEGHALNANLSEARRDLNEAWEIAERGPMPLFLAEIHLHRARLFSRETVYPWNQHPDGRRRDAADDLEAARDLIEKHGYWRRKEELENAEKAYECW